MFRAQGGRGKGAECPAEAVCELRFDTTPGKDTVAGIWTGGRKERKATPTALSFGSPLLGSQIAFAGAPIFRNAI